MLWRWVTMAALVIVFLLTILHCQSAQGQGIPTLRVGMDSSSDPKDVAVTLQILGVGA